jgi:AraC family transcriptional activator of tynA and feaB
MTVHRESKMQLQPITKHVKVKSLSADSVSPIFIDLEMREAAAASGTFAISELDGLSVVRSTTRGSRFQALRLKQHIGRATTHAFFACVPLRGSLALAQGGRNCTLARGDIGLMDSRTEYTLGMSEELDALWIRIAPERLEERLSGIEQFMAKRIDGSQGLGMIASRFIVATASQVEVLAHQRETSMSSILMDLLCSAAAADDVWPLTSRTAMRNLERARDFIDHHLGEEDLTPSQIASGVGISTRYLSELFAKEGTTVMGWVVRRRLELVRAAVEGRQWSPGLIADVAYRHGFCNISSFNRAFKASFGVPPRSLMGC